MFEILNLLTELQRYTMKIELLQLEIAVIGQ
jgi:hypothetical protein